MQRLMNERFVDMRTSPQSVWQGVSRREHGFTLIELMITVAIIGILAAIAYPNYTQYVQRANRVDAQAIMLENTQFMERYYTTNNTYVGAVLPKTNSPASSTAATRKYLLDLNPATTATTFRIRAQLRNSNVDPLCGTMTLNQAGTRTEAGTGALADCWKS